MAKVKTYWDEIKNDEVFFYGGNQGWEVHVRWETYRDWNRKTGESVVRRRLTPQWPFGYGDGVSREEKALCRKDVNLQIKKRRILAQASRNQTEYRDLMGRVYGMEESEFNKIIQTGLKGFELGNYICHNYLTDSEAHALFWRM